MTSCNRRGRRWVNRQPNGGERRQWTAEAPQEGGRARARRDSGVPRSFSEGHAGTRLLLVMPISPAKVLHRAGAGLVGGVLQHVTRHVVDAADILDQADGCAAAI